MIGHFVNMGKRIGSVSDYWYPGEIKTLSKFPNGNWFRNADPKHFWIQYNTGKRERFRRAGEELIHLLLTPGECYDWRKRSGEIFLSLKFISYEGVDAENEKVILRYKRIGEEELNKVSIPLDKLNNFSLMNIEEEPILIKLRITTNRKRRRQELLEKINTKF